MMHNPPHPGEILKELYFNSPPPPHPVRYDPQILAILKKFPEVRKKLSSLVRIRQRRGT